MCYFFKAYVVKVLKMAILPVKLCFGVLDNKIDKSTHFLYKNGYIDIRSEYTNKNLHVFILKLHKKMFTSE